MHDPNDDTTALLTCTDRFRMLRITAQLYGAEELEKIAILGEEIATKSAFAHTQFRMKACLDSLWDALTTVKFIFSNGIANTKDEQKILRIRLEKQLQYVGTLVTGKSDDTGPELTLEVPSDWIFEPAE